jgi:ABC-type oligopeptide transport system ATPase subunit
MDEVTGEKLIIEAIKQSLDPVYNGAKHLGKEQLNKLKVNLNICFNGYLTRYLKKYSKTKTLLYRDQPVNIKEFYVRTDLELENDIIVDSKVFDLINDKKRLVVSGTAGCGKSTFCKSLFIDMVELKVGVIPVLVELRHLNKESKESVIDFIFMTMADIEKSLTKAQVEYALERGKVCLLLDGFDEIDNSLKELYEKEVLELSVKYEELKIVVFSRPDNRFCSWDEFYVAKVQPLDKEKAKSLIHKLEYDRVTKTKFLEDLDNSLYEKHISFASNPLLLTMMLLTYEQIAEIPNKIHLFYEQAFLTLFNKHDSLKSIYKRKSHSGLPLDDFKKVLSAFSIVSYKDSKFHFSEGELIEIIKKATKLSAIEVSPIDFMNDLIESVCIIQRDGLGYTFTHRSFQEYFTANYLKNAVVSKKFDLIDKIACLQSGRDDVIPMLYEMNNELIEVEWIIPKLKYFIKKYAHDTDKEEGLRVFARLYKGLILLSEDGIGFLLNSEKKDLWLIHLLMRIYPSIRDGVYPIGENKKISEFKYLSKLIGEGNTLDLKVSNINSMSEDIKSELYDLGLSKHVGKILKKFSAKLEELESKKGQSKSDIDIILFGE